MEIKENIIKKHKQDKLEEYLSNRGLKPFEGVYWADNVIINNQLYSGLFIIISSYVAPVALIEYRSNDGWDKIYQAECGIPIYNIKKVSKYKNVIITESVLDAESINQSNIPYTIAISTHKSSFSLAQFHMIMAMRIKYKFKLYIAFDNDQSGIKATERFRNKAKDLYNTDIKSISIPYKDINTFKVKSKNFKKSIEIQLKGH